MTKIIKINRRQTEELGCSLFDFCSIFIGSQIKEYMNSYDNRKIDVKIGSTEISTIIYHRELRGKSIPYVTVLSEIWLPTELTSSDFYQLIRRCIDSERESLIYTDKLLWKSKDNGYINRFHGANDKRLVREIKSMLTEKAIEEAHA